MYIGSSESIHVKCHIGGNQMSRLKFRLNRLGYRTSAPNIEQKTVCSISGLFKSLTVASAAWK